MCVCAMMLPTQYPAGKEASLPTLGYKKEFILHQSLVFDSLVWDGMLLTVLIQRLKNVVFRSSFYVCHGLACEKPDFQTDALNPHSIISSSTRKVAANAGCAERNLCLLNWLLSFEHVQDASVRHLSAGI